MKGRLRVATFWLRPKGENSLPESGHRLEQLLARFYQHFPEYQGALRFLQSPIEGRQVFVYTEGGPNLLPDAGEYLGELLAGAFPGAQIKPYGRLLRRPG